MKFEIKCLDCLLSISYFSDNNYMYLLACIVGV